jgi:transposase
MEATGVYWKPVRHVLEGRFQQILANAAHIKGVPGRKSDMNDAIWIADLLAHGLMRASFVPPQPIQELRDLTRTRKQLTREIVQHTSASRPCSRKPTSNYPRSSRTCWGQVDGAS